MSFPCSRHKRRCSRWRGELERRRAEVVPKLDAGIRGERGVHAPGRGDVRERDAVRRVERAVDGEGQRRRAVGHVRGAPDHVADFPIAIAGDFYITSSSFGGR